MACLTRRAETSSSSGGDGCVWTIGALVGRVENCIA